LVAVAAVLISAAVCPAAGTMVTLTLSSPRSSRAICSDVTVTGEARVAKESITAVMISSRSMVSRERRRRVVGAAIERVKETATLVSGGRGVQLESVVLSGDSTRYSLAVQSVVFGVHDVMAFTPSLNSAAAHAVHVASDVLSVDAVKCSPAGQSVFISVQVASDVLSVDAVRYSPTGQSVFFGVHASAPMPGLKKPSPQGVQAISSDGSGSGASRRRSDVGGEGDADGGGDGDADGGGDGDVDGGGADGGGADGGGSAGGGEEGGAAAS
jgi:hypothetical protein